MNLPAYNLVLTYSQADLFLNPGYNFGRPTGIVNPRMSVGVPKGGPAKIKV
jgi:hypothetical protein